MRGHCSGTPMSTKPRHSTAALRTSSETSDTAKWSSFWMAKLLAVPLYAMPMVYMPPYLHHMIAREQTAQEPGNTALQFPVYPVFVCEPSDQSTMHGVHLIMRPAPHHHGTDALARNCALGIHLEHLQATSNKGAAPEDRVLVSCELLNECLCPLLTTIHDQCQAQCQTADDLPASLSQTILVRTCLHTVEA